MLERPLYSTKSIGPRTFSMIVLPMDYILWLYNSFSKKVLDNTFFCHLEMINFVMCPHFKGSFELIKYSNVRFLFVKWLKHVYLSPKVITGVLHNSKGGKWRIENAINWYFCEKSHFHCTIYSLFFILFVWFLGKWLFWPQWCIPYHVWPLATLLFGVRDHRKLDFQIYGYFCSIRLNNEEAVNPKILSFTKKKLGLCFFHIRPQHIKKRRKLKDPTITDAWSAEKVALK